MADRFVDIITRRPGIIALMLLATTLVLGALAAIPSLWPGSLGPFPAARIDTDPENMLRRDEPVRTFTDRMKRALDLHDIVVLGVVNERHPDGVFNVETLRKVWDVTALARTIPGVVGVDVIAPSTVDNIEQAGPGAVRFEWLMPAPPDSDAEARAVRDKARRLPFLDGTLVSEDGRALALYLPLTSKDVSHGVYVQLREWIAGTPGDEEWHITGLPVAEDVFGVEMFVQMAISAPLAMLVIFLLMLYFFRKPVLVISPMIVAMGTVICTMAGLVISGNTIHIMSSMIPIFLMPIAVLDSVHILSEFFDRYPQVGDRRVAIRDVMRELFTPMLYTSLTSAAGFASLALTPIPPVRVFGIFVAGGVLLAWFLTIVIIPAYVMLMSERSLRGFGLQTAGDRRSPLMRLLSGLAVATDRRAPVVIALAAVTVALSIWGISRIEINDNPIKWFRASHPIRQADRVLNAHFGGTYMAYLAIESKAKSDGPGVEVDRAPAAAVIEPPRLPAGLGGTSPLQPEQPPQSADLAPEMFKEPEMLRWISALQQRLETTGVVGKSNSVADVVKTVHRELIDGSDEHYRIPDTRQAVAQTLVQYQSSHRPGDLWHFVTPDYQTANIWVQMTSGDNKDMERVISAVDEFMEAHPPPGNVEEGWFGLTYVNVVWQDKMVAGMLRAFLGSFVIVLVMMTLLFRSPLWGLLAMVPLTLTIGLIYGVIGIVGKDYDMPVAVLSSLTLGLAVDFAIHFLVRTRAIYAERGSWAASRQQIFGEPARAIARNVVVIAVGFTPLLIAPLVPYNTVGIFLASILLISGVATLVILPAILRLSEPLMFRSFR